MRLRVWLSVAGLSILLVNCEALFGFRDLEIESTHEEDDEELGGEGGEGGAGAEGGDVTSVGGMGGDAGYGGDFGGYGGDGGFSCGFEVIGANCDDGLECESCICEDAGTQQAPESVCCEETCAPCHDCDPAMGFCYPVEDFSEDFPDCFDTMYCVSGVCQQC